MGKTSRNEIQSERERLDVESEDIQEHLELRTTDIENVSVVFEEIMESGTDEGFQNVMDHVSNAHEAGEVKFDETSEELGEKTQEIQENEQEIQESADEVNENCETIREVESNLDGSEVISEIQNAEQANSEDFEFLGDAREQLQEIVEKSEQVADELGSRAEEAKAKGVR